MPIQAISAIDTITYNGSGEVTGLTYVSSKIFLFDSIIGDIKIAEEPIEVNRRKGIKNHSLRAFPATAEPFSLIGIIHLENDYDWGPLLNLYQGLKKNPEGVEIQRNTTEVSYPYDVLSVQLVKVKAAAGGVGTLVDLADDTVTAVASYRFTLIARDLTDGGV